MPYLALATSYDLPLAHIWSDSGQPSKSSPSMGVVLGADMCKLELEQLLE